MTTIEKLNKLEFHLDEVRRKVAGLGIMSALIRDIKNDVIAMQEKPIPEQIDFCYCHNEDSVEIVGGKMICTNCNKKA